MEVGDIWENDSQRETDHKANWKVDSGSHNIHVTIVAVGLSCQANY